MDETRAQNGSQSSRILMFSQRNIYEHAVWRCAFHEFEELVRSFDSVDLIAPKPTSWYRNGKRLALRSGERFRTPINPGVPEIRLNKYYDAFFAVCEKPSELLNLVSIKGLKDYCKATYCWVPEYYAWEIPSTKSCMEVLSRFDHVIYMFDHNEPFKQALGGKGVYLPSGVDTELFCPYPNPPERTIDVLSVGRRAQETHEALMGMMRDEGKFYEYDTINDLKAYTLEDHRFLFANRAKRSRYFLANPGKINMPEETGGQVEFGYRFFEGAAPGTIMLGVRPRNRQFDKIFHWDDAIIEVPFGSREIVDVIHELDRQPERLERARTQNITQCLLHHDWAHRWETILAMSGMKPLPALTQRKERLARLAQQIQAGRQETQTAAVRH